MSERGDWMLTATGGEFYPLDPRPEEVQIKDIAHALAMSCRYGGHTTHFYSVAEHCVLMAQHAPAGLEMTTLLHDASEAYLQDIIRPVKVHLANYLSIENRLMYVIGERFGFSWPMPAEVKRLDEAMIGAEREQAVRFPLNKAWSQWKPVEPLPVKIQFWPPALAKERFLLAFYRYGGK